MELDSETRLINGIVLIHTGINLLKREELPEITDYELSPMIERVYNLSKK